MNEINVSVNGRYIFFEGVIYDTLNDISFNEKQCGTNFWLNFIKENSIFCNLNEKMDTFSLNKMLRSVLYEISNRINTSKKYDLLCEFEKKYGSNLILEINNSLNFGRRLSESWDFIIKKVNEYGLIKEANDASSFDNWVKTKGSKFIEGLREKLFSVVGFGVQTVLSFTGVGTLGITAVYGALLTYDVYMAINGQANWFNIIFDIIGLIPGMSRISSKIFKSASSSAKSASSIEGVVSEISKTKFGPQFLKILNKVGSVSSTIIKAIGDGISWLSRKLGIKYLFDISKKIISFLNNVITKITDAAAKFSQGKAVLGAKWGSAQNVGHALAKGAKDVGIGYGLTKGLEKI